MDIKKDLLMILSLKELLKINNKFQFYNRKD